jgi:ABC-2 type transport system ATP-binding protein
VENMSREAIVQAEGLTKNYGNTRALDGLNLSIFAGEVFGLLGPNGSGKSTAIRLFLGMLRPDHGFARIGGFDCWKDSLRVRKMVSYLPGELRLYDNLTGRQLLRFLEGLRGQSVNGDATKLASRYGIDLDRPLAQLSSGMKRKVALMQVMLAKTPVAVLDEPTNTLDPTMRDELLDQIKEAQQQGQTILFSSHVLHEVERVCDRVAILASGRLVHLQQMPELMSQRRATVQFRQVPTTPVPDNIAVERNGLSWQLHLTDQLHATLAWLADQDVAEVRIEPEGLAGIYQRHHANDREALQR